MQNGTPPREGNGPSYGFWEGNGHPRGYLVPHYKRKRNIPLHRRGGIRRRWMTGWSIRLNCAKKRLSKFAYHLLRLSKPLQSSKNILKAVYSYFPHFHLSNTYISLCQTRILFIAYFLLEITYL